MNVTKRSKKGRSNKALFNPYKNGISKYDMAYLSSKKVLISKTDYLEIDRNVSIAFSSQGAIIPIVIQSALKIFVSTSSNSFFT